MIVISLILDPAFLSSAPLRVHYSVDKSTLAVAPAGVRETGREARAMAYQRRFDEQLAPEGGGKIAWDMTLERLAPKIGFRTASSVRFLIRDLWAEFIENENNEALVKEGNRIVAEEFEKHGRITAETQEKLRTLIIQFKFPDELKDLISLRVEDIAGWIISRSSGRFEDSYLQNLAGVLISCKRRDPLLVANGVEHVFKQALETIWLNEHEITPAAQKDEARKPEIVTAESGIGVLVQPFYDFDASGTAKTDRYGYTSFSAVIGDADFAVRQLYAVSCQYLFKKGQHPENAKFEFNPAFINIPYKFRLKGTEYSAEADRKKLEEVMSGYPKIGGKFSPLTEAHAREVYRVLSELEDEIGVPLDVEWGFFEGELYVIQIRPIIGDFRKPLVTPDPSLENLREIARTPIAIGHTKPEGFTSRVVVFGNDVKEKDIARFEQEFNDEYIRVQFDVATSVYKGGKTSAKVLVDPVFGTTEAHNITLVEGRIAAGEFIYANGPVIREGLANNLTLIPHPTIRGIWVSEEEVTYFCDGLRAQFFISKKEEGQEELNYRQSEINRIQKAIQDEIFKSDSEHKTSPYFSAKGLVLGLFTEAGRDIKKAEAINDAFNEENHNIEFINSRLDSDSYTMDDLHMAATDIMKLEEVLSNPLYPAAWESEYSKLLRGVSFIKKAWGILTVERRELATPPDQLPQDHRTSGKIRLLFVDDQDLYTASSLRTILPEDLYEIEKVDNGYIAAKRLLEKGYDIVMTDLAIRGMDALGKYLDHIDNVIIISGNFLNENADYISDAVKKRATWVDKPFSVGEDLVPLVQAARAEKLAALEEASGAVIASPALSEVEGLARNDDKLRVLWIEDEPNYRKSTLELWRTTMSGDLYEFTEASSMSIAAHYLQTAEFDVIVYDPMMLEHPGKIGNSNLELLKEKARSAIRLAAVGGLLESEYRTEEILGSKLTSKVRFFSKAEFCDGYEDFFARARAEKLLALEAQNEVTAPDDIDRGGEFAREAANDMAEELERIAKDRELHPDKFRVIILDDEAFALRPTMRAIKEDLSLDEYDVEVVDHPYRAREHLKRFDYDLVIVDAKFYDLSMVKDFLLKSRHIAFQSGLSRPELEDEVGEELAAHSRKFFQKPYNPSEVIGYIEAARAEKLAALEQAEKASNDAEIALSLKPYSEADVVSVLVIEDDHMARKDIQDAFSGKSTVKAVYCSSCSGAYQYLKEYTFDLVIVDYKVGSFLPDELSRREEEEWFKEPLEKEIEEALPRSMARIVRYASRQATLSGAKTHFIIESAFMLTAEVDLIKSLALNTVTTDRPDTPSKIERDIVEPAMRIRAEKLRKLNEKEEVVKNPERFKVLYVDGDEAGRKEAMEYFAKHFGLEDEGGRLVNDKYEIIFVPTEEEAIALINKENIGWAISEWMLPDAMSGPSRLMRALQEKGVNSIGIRTRGDEEDYMDVRELYKKYAKLSNCNELRRAALYIEENKALIDKRKERAAREKVPVRAQDLVVLIIQDEEEILWRLEDLVTRRLGDGYRVICARSFGEAKGKMGGIKIDYCLYDRDGTGMDDRGSLKELRTMFGNAMQGVSLDTGRTDPDTVAIIKKDLADAGFKPEDLGGIYYGISGDRFVNILQSARSRKLAWLEAQEKAIDAEIASPAPKSKPIELARNDDVAQNKPKPYRVFVSDHTHSHNYSMERYKKLYPGLFDFKEVLDHDLYILDEELKKTGYDAQAVIVHMARHENIDIILEIFERVRQHNPEAYLVIDAGINFDPVLDKILAFEKKWGPVRRNRMPYRMSDFYGDLVARAKLAREKEEEGRPSDDTEIASSLPLTSFGVAPRNDEAGRRKTLFVLDSDSGDGSRVAKALGAAISVNYDVTYCEQMGDLRRALKKTVPDVVVMNDSMPSEDRTAIEDTGSLVGRLKVINPEIKIIVASDEAAFIDRKDLPEGVIALVEKPFHFRDIIDILGGTYETKRVAAHERFRIDESKRVFDDMQKAGLAKGPSTIRIWDGYAAPKFQKSLMTRIRKMTAGGLYKVEFCKLEELLDGACKAGPNDNIVSIVPEDQIDKSDKLAIADTKARVLYINLPFGFHDAVSDDMVQLNSIIFAGVAYLNRNSNALMRLYRLLTDKKPDSIYTVEELIEDPARLIFIIRSARIHDYQELKRLNERMEKALRMA